MEEKRKNARVRANVVISFKVKTTRLMGSSRIKDISETGICIPSRHYFPIDSLIEVEIRSESLKESIKVLARVVRVVNRNSSKFQFEVGLQLLDLPVDRRNMLHDYIGRIIAQGESQDLSWLD